MGNCQAVDTATLVIQHPSGKVERFYSQITAGEIMKMNPGHYVALLITTTLYHPSNVKKTDNSSKTSFTATKSNEIKSNNSDSLRVTRVKLLRPVEIMALGHVYRLISSQEVMKGLVAKKQAKLKKNGTELADKEDAFKDLEKAVKRYQLDKNHEVNKQERQRSRATNGSTARPKTWQPSLKSISEAAS